MRFQLWNANLYPCYDGKYVSNIIMALNGTLFQEPISL